nr:hypothetical protein CFP56_10246 [Quercus suber]
MNKALENISLSDLIPIDNTFLSRLDLRRQLIATHPTSTLQCNPIAAPAVLEFYTWMTRTYLPTRFPTIYHISPTDQALLNTATSTLLPLTPSSPLTALRSLGENIDTDFLFLTADPPSPSSESLPTYTLQAFAACFPAGFSTRAKSGLSLSAIHAPVPGYSARLEKSMDRFFARLELGRVVKRANWSISTDDVLFKETGNHFYSSSSSSSCAGAAADDEDEEMQRQRAAVEIAACRLRCERQTLHRLPRSRALVFAFKTYMYPLDEVKRDGDGEALALAIEGLDRGNAPGMKFYKRGVVWGDKVREFLRADLWDRRELQAKGGIVGVLTREKGRGRIEGVGYVVMGLTLETVVMCHAHHPGSSRLSRCTVIRNRTANRPTTQSEEQKARNTEEGDVVLRRSLIKILHFRA